MSFIGQPLSPRPTLTHQNLGFRQTMTILEKRLPSSLDLTEKDIPLVPAPLRIWLDAGRLFPLSEHEDLGHRKYNRSGFSSAARSDGEAIPIGCGDLLSTAKFDGWDNEAAAVHSYF